MLIGGLIAVLVLAGIVVGVVLRRRSHDDAHSVEHYHRKLHTLEEMRAHPHTVGSAGPAIANGHDAANGSSNGDADANDSGTAGEESAGGHVSYPASAVRISGSSTVRLTDPSQVASTVSPVPPLPLANAEPVAFDDSGPEPIPSTFMTGNEREMESINIRPRRLGGPLAAVAVVAVLVIVLIVTGLHSNTPSHSGHQAGTPTTVHAHSTAPAPATHTHRPAVTTTTAPAPVVSAPTSSSSQSATYVVGSANYALALSATTGECWMQATDTNTGAVLFSGTLFSGQSHTVSATGPVTVVSGAPSAFAATVNGVAVTLPQGYQAPFTLKFTTPPASG